MYIKVIGLMIKHKEKVYICIKMGPHILESGLTINNMDMGKKNG
jgi:hypothetical protein